MEEVSITFLTKKFKEFYDLEKSYKNQMDDARKTKEQWEEALLEKMTEEEVQNIKTADGLFYSREDFFASYDKDREVETFVWLREEGDGGLIKETINARTLASWAKEKKEQCIELPNFFNTTIKRRIGVRSK
jgi:hypothetical protein